VALLLNIARLEAEHARLVAVGCVSSAAGLARLIEHRKWQLEADEADDDER
jgi:putative effector of murein hydrolase